MTGKELNSYLDQEIMVCERIHYWRLFYCVSWKKYWSCV